MAVKKISELTSLGSTPDSNDVFLITDTSGAVSRKVTMANVASFIDSDYIQLRDTPQDFAYSSLTGTPSLLDSALVTQLIDSDYIQLRQSSVASGGGLDSALVTQLIDSAYIQLRDTPQDFAYSSLTGTPSLLDSALVTQLIDSDYVQIRGGRSLFLRKSNDSDYSLTFNQTTPIDQNRHVLGDSALSNDSDGYQIPYDGTYTFTGNYFKNSSLHNNVVEVHILLFKNGVFLDRTVALSVAGTGDNKSADGTFVEKCQKGDIFKFRVFSWSNSGTNNSLQISDGTFRSTCSSNGLVPTNSV